MNESNETSPGNETFPGLLAAGIPLDCEDGMPLELKMDEGKNAFQAKNPHPPGYGADAVRDRKGMM